MNQQLLSHINTKSGEDCNMIEDTKQPNDDISKIKAEAFTFQQFENLTYKQKTFQNDMEALKKMHDKLECYIAHKPADLFDKFDILNPVKNVTNETKSALKNETPIIKKRVPCVIESEEPFISDGSISLRYSLTTDSVICSIKFNPSGSQFVFSDGRTIFYTNSCDGSINGTCKIPISDGLIQSLFTRSICFSPDSHYLAFSCQNNKIMIINNVLKNIIANLDFHSNIVSTLTFSNDSKYLYSGGYDGKICLCDLSTMKLIKFFQSNFSDNKSINESVVNISINQDNSFLIVGYNSGRVAFIDLMLDHVIKSFFAHKKGIMCVCTRGKNEYNDGNFFATTSQDKTVKIWESNRFKCTKTLTGHSGNVITACFAPYDPLIFTGSKDETIKGWNENNGKQLFTIHSHKNTIFQIDHHPSEKTFISCSGDGIICVWDYNVSIQCEPPEQQNQ